MEALGSEEDICGGHSLAPIQAAHFMYDAAPFPPGLSSTFPSAARLFAISRRKQHEHDMLLAASTRVLL